MPRYIITAATDERGHERSVRRAPTPRAARCRLTPSARVLVEVHLPDRVAGRGLDARRDRAHLVAGVDAVARPGRSSGSRARITLPARLIASRNATSGSGVARVIAVDDVERDHAGAGGLEVVDELRHLVAWQRVPEALGVDRLGVEADHRDVASSGAAGKRASVARRWKPPKTSAFSPIAAKAVTETVRARIDTIRRITTRRFSASPPPLLDRPAQQSWRG